LLRGRHDEIASWLQKRFELERATAAAAEAAAGKSATTAKSSATAEA
jgi:hypothetical protein